MYSIKHIVMVIRQGMSDDHYGMFNICIYMKPLIRKNTHYVVSTDLYIYFALLTVYGTLSFFQ